VQLVPAAERLPALPGMRVGLALGSGSIHGLAHIGVIEALEARGVEVKVVAGTSVGALVGSL
jgi:NTE family protein